MKKSLVSMAALALIMASCSNDEENVIDNGEVANAVPVQISQKVSGVETKAAVTVGSDMTAVILMADGDNPAFTPFTPRTENVLTGEQNNTLANDAARANVSNTQFKASTTAGEIELTPTLYYPVSSASTKAYILGVSPKGVVNGTTVTFSDVDGLQDVMYATKVNVGTSGSPESSIELNFTHETTQLTFDAKLDNADLSKTEWAGKDVSVKTITIQKAKLPESLTFSTGEINWTAEKSISVLGCNTALTAKTCAPSVPVMVAPATNILVDLELSVGGQIKVYNNLPVKKDGGENLVTVKGKSHLVTFTITAPTAAAGAEKVTTSAKVTDWEPGEKGSVTVK